MSKKIVNALKAKVKKLKYADLKSIPVKSGCWSFGYNTYCRKSDTRSGEIFL